VGLRHGAKQLIDQIEAHEKEGFRLLDLAAQRVKYNPDFAIEKIHESQEEFRQARKLREERLPDMLQKAAPPVERQLAELRQMVETQAARLDAALEQSNVVRFRKEG
jgi:hypothetical protein